MCERNGDTIVLVDTVVGTPPDSTGRALTDARERGLPIEIHERPPARSVPEAAAILGLEPDGIVKSLVVRRGAGDYLFAMLPANKSLSWPLLRAAAGANRMSLPDAEDALAVTGYERGTISPIGCSAPWPVFLDTSVAARIAIGCGSRQHSALIDRDAFIAAYGVTVTPLSE